MMITPLGITNATSDNDRYTTEEFSAPIRPLDDVTNECFVQLLRSQFASGNGSPEYALWTAPLSQPPRSALIQRNRHGQLAEPEGEFRSENEDEEIAFESREDTSTRERGFERIYLVLGLLSFSSFLSFALYDVVVIHPYLSVALMPLCVTLWLISRRT